MRPLLAAALAAALAGGFALAVGVGEDDEPRAQRKPATTATQRGAPPAPRRPATTTTTTELPRSSAPPCPADVPRCARVEGRVVYVERVDPDGDGDLHVVVADGASISLPGVTAVDVRRGLRPSQDPSAGDRVTAMGPIQPGSFGQDQIHALTFAVG